MAKLRFGYFIAPFHRAGTNPTLALQRDLEFIEHLDALGFDEVWLGEHHSAGSEIISSPEVFIAAAAERAKWIRSGTGVISLVVPQPALGRRPADAAGSPHPWPHDRRCGAGLPAQRLVDDRADPDRHARAARNQSRHRGPAAGGGDGERQDRHASSCSTPSCSLPRTPMAGSRCRSPRSHHRRVRGWPASMASACCPSGRR